MKTVYEIRLKSTGADNADFLETEVACFDSAVMILLSCSQSVADVEYSTKACVWTSEAVRQALLACSKLSGVRKPPKKFSDSLQQRKDYLERVQLRLSSLKPELDSASKKRTLCVAPCSMKLL